MTAGLTRFVQFNKATPESKKMPITAVLHTKFGNALGDLPAYDAFLLGGPYSVRGYNIGELAACRRFVEAAAEVRVPVKGNTVFAYAEWGSDLGSSAEVRGNPTEYYRRLGSGASIGGGVKVGGLRAEAVRDCNQGKWHLLLNYGDRF
jgi:outer membrane protein assembly factor BamA